MHDFRLLPQSTGTVLFWVITQQVVVISYQHFRTTYQSHLQGVKNPKESLLSQYGVYMGKRVGIEKSCQPIGLLQVVGMEGSVGVSAALEREVL
jgi:hypothetical protein